MPSGSHGGSRGSHSSGGSRSGGSFGGGRSSFGGRHSGSSFGGSGGFHPRPRRFRWGGHYYVVTSGTQSILMIMLFFIMFFGMFAFSNGINRSVLKEEISLIEQDYIYYQDMIDYAESQGGESTGYIVNATVTGKYYNADAERYYFVYEIELPNTSRDLEGYTYSCYTITEASIYRVGDVMKVAVESPNITINTDSINMDYKDMPLERDGEYLAAKSSLKSATTSMIIFILVDVAIVAIGVFVVIKKKQLAEEKEAKEEKVKAEANADVYCSYCGSVVSKNTTKCPNCGSSVRK